MENCPVCFVDKQELVKICDKHCYCEDCKELCEKYYIGKNVCMFCSKNTSWSTKPKYIIYEKKDMK